MTGSVDGARWDVWFDENTNTIRHRSEGVNDKKLADDSIARLYELLDEHPDVVGVLVDVSKTASVNGPARQAYGEFVKSLDKKVSFFGANRVMTVVIKLVFGSAGRLDNMKILQTEEEALAWLNEA